MHFISSTSEEMNITKNSKTMYSQNTIDQQWIIICTPLMKKAHNISKTYYMINYKYTIILKYNTLIKYSSTGISTFVYKSHLEPEITTWSDNNVAYIVMGQGIHIYNVYIQCARKNGSSLSYASSCQTVEQISETWRHSSCVICNGNFLPRIIQESSKSQRLYRYEL